MNEDKHLRLSTIQARDLNEAWFLCLKEILENGYTYTIERGSFAGSQRKELDMITLQIKYPNTRPLVPIVPEGVPQPVSEDYIDTKYFNYLISPEGPKLNESYTYGEDIFPQFMEVLRMYGRDGFQTNQATISVGNRESIYLDDPQCLRIIDTRVRYGKLHFVVYFRSWDLWGGFPANLAGIQRLKESMAAMMGVKDGDLIAMSKGLHLYEHQWDVAEMVVNR